MFSGIIEETGRVKHLTGVSRGAEICIECKTVLEDTSVGDSISVNGVCLTVNRMDDGVFWADVSFETLARSNIGYLGSGSVVNLERAIKVGGRVGGHFVLGHVDGVFRLVSLERRGEFFSMRIEVDDKWRRYCVEKGSVAVDGISLTVSSVSSVWFECVVIPHTFDFTNLRFRRVGDGVNVEFDIIAKYVKSFVTDGGDMYDLLKKSGFIGA